MAQFRFVDTSLRGLIVVQRQLADDSRGFFSRFFCAEEFAAAGWVGPLAQINHSLTRTAGSVRGLHFQHPPHSEFKLVSCLHGEIFDVAVDLRRSSPSFLQWHAEILSAGNRRSLLIPGGFAHGFQALTEACELLYLHSAPYRASAEGGLNAVDPGLAIAWPLPVGERSARDSALTFIGPEFAGVET
jgi:dTDP-4-dehydrorhamnose 3,5-epimerase